MPAGSRATSRCSDGTRTRSRSASATRPPPATSTACCRCPTRVASATCCTKYRPDSTNCTTERPTCITTRGICQPGRSTPPTRPSPHSSPSTPASRSTRCRRHPNTPSTAPAAAHQRPHLLARYCGWALGGSPTSTTIMAAGWAVLVVVGMCIGIGCHRWTGRRCCVRTDCMSSSGPDPGRSSDLSGWDRMGLLVCLGVCTYTDGYGVVNTHCTVIEMDDCIQGRSLLWASVCQ
mmetsp:Transcript_18656/g.53446  ORF Transcript_18656/g.53446 Transcript_18656/m.53446 type:complete len:234 (-) Transcript_18656:302-1003(-)